MTFDPPSLTASTLPRRRPSVLAPILLFFAVFGLLLSADSVLVTGLLILRVPPGHDMGDLVASAKVAEEMFREPLVLSGIAAFHSLLFGISAPIALRLAREKETGLGVVRPSGSRLLGPAAAMFGFAGLSVAYGAAGDLLGLRGGAAVSMAEAVHRATIPELMVCLFTIAMMAGVGEELFFRGFLQRALRRRLPRWGAIGVASFAFGLVHMDLFQSPFAFVAGLFLGWVAERTASIVVTILSHIFNNAMFVIWAYLSNASEHRASVVLLLLGGAVFGASLFLFRRTLRAPSTVIASAAS